MGRGPRAAALIDSGEISSIILWGPAGSGKPALAHIIARASKAPFEPSENVSDS